MNLNIFSQHKEKGGKFESTKALMMVLFSFAAFNILVKYSRSMVGVELKK